MNGQSQKSATTAGLNALILAIHEDALLTAAAKRLTGAMAESAALQETAALVSAHSGRDVSEERVMRTLLMARRTRVRAEAGPWTDAAVIPAIPRFHRAAVRRIARQGIARKALALANR